VGVRVGNQTVADAGSWGLPAGTPTAPGTAIFIDIEGGQKSGSIDEQFIRDWYDKVIAGGYTPGFYGSDIDNFDTSFCAAVQDEPDIGKKSLFWTFDPNTLPSSAKPGPAFTSHIITCSSSNLKVDASRTVMYQYNQNTSQTNADGSAHGEDEDETRGSIPVWKP
jgi:hypothetical protein